MVILGKIFEWLTHLGSISDSLSLLTGVKNKKSG